MHLVKRYMEEVMIYVTFSKRKEVKEDVLRRIGEVAVEQENKNIEDLSEEEAMKVLDTLGSPRELGRNYYKCKSKIIGRESVASYHRVLLLSMIFALFGNALAYFFMDTSNGNKVSAVFVLSKLVISLAFLYIFITLIFYVANYILKNEEEKEEHARGKWTALHLRYPMRKRPNKRMDYISGLLFKIILLTVLFVAGDRLFIGAVVRDGGNIQRIPLFFTERIQDFKVLISIMLIVSIGYSVSAIWRNRPDFVLLIWKSISAIFNAIGCVFLFGSRGIWNVEFANQMQSAGINALQSFTMQSLASFTVAIILLIAAINIMHAFYRFFSNI